MTYLVIDIYFMEVRIMRKKVSHIISIDIPNHGIFKLLHFEDNSVCIKNLNKNLIGRSDNLFDAMKEAEFPIDQSYIDRIQEATNTVIYQILHHRSSIQNNICTTCISMAYKSLSNEMNYREYCARHCLDEYRSDYSIHPNTIDTPHINIASIVKNSYGKDMQGIHFSYEKDLKDTKFDSKNTNTDYDLSSIKYTYENEWLSRISFQSSNERIDISKLIDRFNHNNIVFTLASNDVGYNHMDLIDILNIVEIYKADDIAKILHALQVKAYHILQHEPYTTQTIDVHNDSEIKECIVRRFSICKFNTDGPEYGFVFSVAMIAIQEKDHPNKRQYYMMTNPFNIPVEIPEKLNHPYTKAIEKFLSEDPKCCSGTVYLDKNNPNAMAFYKNES